MTSSASTTTLPRYANGFAPCAPRSEEHTSELQSRLHLVCRLLLEKKKFTCTSTSTSSPPPPRPPLSPPSPSISCFASPVFSTRPTSSLPPPPFSSTIQTSSPSTPS